MSPVRVVIVDDEPLSRRALRQQLATFSAVVVIAECEDVDSARAWLDDADAIFLDIELLGTSGLSLARELESRPLPAIVFVTAFDEYAVPAFATEAVDYLTKPVEAQRLGKTIARIEAHVARHTGAHRNEAATGVSRAMPGPRHVTARVGTREEFIPFAQIECVEADGVYACVVQRERRVLVRYSMAALEQLLPSGEFLRVHRSWIVRRALIRAVRAVGGGVHRELLLSNGLAVPVSRRRLPDILRQLRGVGQSGTGSQDPSG